MRRLHILWHWAQDPILPRSTVEEAALESQLYLAPLAIDLRVHDKQPVAVAPAGRPWGVAAADSDGVRGLLDDFEVVGNLGARLVGGGREVTGRPEVVGGFGLVFL